MASSPKVRAAAGSMGNHVHAAFKSASLEQVNADLTDVLGRLDQVEKKVAAEGKRVDGPVGGVELRDYQLQVLARLRQIRDTMKQEGSSLEQLRQERDEARSEAEALKKQVSKLNYRVHHLKQHVQMHGSKVGDAAGLFDALAEKQDACHAVSNPMLVFLAFARVLADQPSKQHDLFPGMLQHSATGTKSSQSQSQSQSSLFCGILNPRASECAIPQSHQQRREEEATTMASSNVPFFPAMEPSKDASALLDAASTSATAACDELPGDAGASDEEQDDAEKEEDDDDDDDDDDELRATDRKKDEARILSQLLLLFCVKRSDAFAAGEKKKACSIRFAVDEEVGKQTESDTKREEATGREHALVQEFLKIPKVSQKKIAQSLFVLQPSLIDNFAPILQFFIRVIIAAHADSHVEPVSAEGVDYQNDAKQEEYTDDDALTRIQKPHYCAWSHNGHVNCVEIEQNENSGNDASSTSSTTATTTFRFPLDFHACLVNKYGSVKRSKCEEVWHGDHMAYRCRTCGLSDSSCMCLGCFNPDDHEGHDYRVYRCSSGGCCDCGDPLAWKPEGFCKKHSVAESGSTKSSHDMAMGELEDGIVKLLVRRTVGFCVNVLREVYLFCLRPGGAYDSDPFYPMRTLPKTGRRRSSFPDIIQVYLDRVQQALAWLQMLATSCVKYRDIVSHIFFEPLPADFHFDPPVPAHHHAHATAKEAHVCADSEQKQSLSDVLEASGGGPAHDESNLLILDVFLKAGVLLPVETCDALGVLYLKLLFDHPFKQKYTCHFVEWYPYYIDLYLKASEENNEDGMRNLSRFIDRLFCQLFHSTAQLQELERVFSSTHNRSMHRRRRRRLSSIDPHTSCVESLMLFLLQKLNGLFKSALRVETIQVKRVRKNDENSDPSAHSESTMLQYVVDCGRNVFKKRIYARLCSDLRTLLVHPQVAAHAVLNSFRISDGKLVLNEKSVYGELVQAFKLLQQMDLQQRHIHQHIEYESQNWTFAFVVDYEVNLLLNAFLSGIPYCFSSDGFLESETPCINRTTSLPAPFNPRDTATFDRIALASALLDPVQTAVLSWTHQSGCPEWSPDDAYVAAPEAEKKNYLLEYYEGSAPSLESPTKKSFHLPLHHMLASLVHSLCMVVQPQSVTEWEKLFSLGVEQELLHGSERGRTEDALEFALSLGEYPLRVCFFTREVKAGLWVRNGNSMWQQLIHYYSKHWRFYGVHSDLYLCQLSALMAPRGSFTRFLLHQFPFDLHKSNVFRVTCDGERGSSGGDQRTSGNKQIQEARHELDVAEEMLRLLLQILLSPVKMATSVAPVESVTWLVEREMMHWLSLGPFTRSEVLMRMDMKLVEQVKQLPGHPWHQLEEEEVLTQVLENVGVYEDPCAIGSGSSLGSGNSLPGFGLKMSGKWKLKPELWAKISPFFECFAPSEAQQCEQNIRNRSPRTQFSASAYSASSPSNLMVPVLPDAHGVALQMHSLLAEKLFNSNYLMGALLIILLNWRQQRDAASKEESKRATSENLLLVALQCVYVGATLLTDSGTGEANENDSLSQLRNDEVPAVDITSSDVASCFGEDISFFAKLCAAVPLGESKTTSFLSLLIGFASDEAALADAKAVAQQILKLADEKSSVCRSLLEKERARIAAQASISSGVAGDSSDGNQNGTNSNDDRERKAKEMMRQRQQMILEKMRSKQMQFLSSHGDAKHEVKRRDETLPLDPAGNPSGDDDSDVNEDEEDDDEEEEEDEWGFPTGQIDVQLYLDHVSSAIALACEKEKKMYDRRRRRRRRSRSSSSSSMAGGMNDERYEKSMHEEEQEVAEECGLCRMPCEGRSSPSSFGFVGMILPTSTPQKLRESSRISTPAFPSIRTMRRNARGGEVFFKLSDTTIWSCGHPVHHECLKSYLSSLWKNKHNRSPTEMMNGEDRLLSERDVEFQCPICRRLSNCLVPSVSLTHPRGQKQTASQPSFRMLDDCEEESKDEDLRDSLVFVKWLDSQMSFRDDLPVVKRRKFRSLSYVRSRLNSSSAERERNSALERSIDKFYNEITLRCLRAAMQLPLLMSGDIQDEGQIEAEIGDAASVLGVHLPAWQIFTRCLEVQVDLVEEEKQLLGIEVVDKQRMQSMCYLADVAVAASAISAQNSLSWTVIDAPHESKFDVVMGKLNGILFGHQVLFEEDEGMRKMEKVDGENSVSSDFLLASPILCHPNLFSFFITRMMWKQGLQTTTASPPDVAVVDLASEAFFLARVLVVAQVLQSLCCIRMSADDAVDDESVGDSIDDEQGAGDEFDRVQSLKGAYRWISQLLARCKLVDTRSLGSKGARKKWNLSRVEEEVSAMCLPLVKRILLLMEVVLPSSWSQNHVAESAEEMCAVCDGLFHHPTAQSEQASSDSKMHELEKYLRRLHLPPLRLFFHPQTFSSDQRGLCQLWGAQLEAKAAVLRQQQTHPSRAQSGAIVRSHGGNLFSSLMSLNNSRLGKSRKRLIISLPRIYMNLFMKYNEKPRGICQRCNQLPQHPAICLFCGVVLCCFSPCCESACGNIGECSQHAQSCGLGFGAFLLLRACTVILFLGNERRCVWGSVYVDKNGEEDPYLRRGKTLYLDESRLVALETLLLSHGFAQNTAILANTSRRDGRRY